MKDVVFEKIQEIRKDESIQVLFACESGSRAWGFPSPDSDYDVRILYVRSIDWYLSIYQGRDVLEFPIDSELDISGWDLKKTLVLMHKSNPVVWEWLQSPMIYTEKGNFRDELLKIGTEFYSPVSGFHHYFTQAEKGWANLSESAEECKIKKLFYILRPLLAARWIAEGLGVPPMDLEGLLKMESVEDSDRSIIRELVEKKSNALESDQIAMPSQLKSWIQVQLDFCKDKKNSLESRKALPDELNYFFRKWLHTAG